MQARWTIRLGLLLGLTAVGIFAPVLSHEFLSYDDGLYVRANPHVRGGLTLAGAAWAATTLRASNWHPLTWLSHMLDCQLFGLDAHGHHLSSLLLHAANTVLLFVLLRR